MTTQTPRPANLCRVPGCKAWRFGNATRGTCPTAAGPCACPAPTAQAPACATCGAGVACPADGYAVTAAWCGHGAPHHNGALTALVICQRCDSGPTL
jgi:hypothetical protein